MLPRLNVNEVIDDRVSPPYDIISPEEQALLQARPFNITRITLGGKDGKYEEAARTLDSWISSGRLVQDGSECYYLYRQRFLEKGEWMTRNGIIGILRTENYEAGNIIPHEETFPKVKEDRLNLLRSTNTHCESIFGLYDRSDLDMERIANGGEGLFEFRDPSETVHELFRIFDRTMVEDIQRTMESKKILIADGHHRYETSYKFSQENPIDEKKRYVLCTMVSSQDKGMFVRPTHRLIRNLKFQEKDLLTAMEGHFSLRQVRDLSAAEAALQDATAPTFGLLFPSGKVVVAEFTAPKGDILWTIDTYVCQEAIFKDILYQMPKGNELVVDYDHDVSSVVSRVKAGGHAVAILVRAPDLETVWKVAQGGRKMPKKTTYFWPKIWSGLVAYRMK